MTGKYCQHSTNLTALALRWPRVMYDLKTNPPAQTEVTQYSNLSSMLERLNGEKQPTRFDGMSHSARSNEVQ